MDVSDLEMVQMCDAMVKMIAPRHKRGSGMFTEIVKLNSSEFKIINLITNIQRYNYGYLMARVSRQPFLYAR